MPLASVGRGVIVNVGDMDGGVEGSCDGNGVGNVVILIFFGGYCNRYAALFPCQSEKSEAMKSLYPSLSMSPGPVTTIPAPITLKPSDDDIFITFTSFLGSLVLPLP